jgi:DNA invertase Pin-like site-specific DNA recombinase
MRVGYVRVSTAEQNPARQLEGIDVERVYTDHASGGSTDRPQLAAMLDFVRDGDTVVVHSMDRLARNLVDLRQTVADLTTRGVQVQFHTEGLTFTNTDSPTNTLLLSVMGAFAEFERTLIKERQREGIALAKTRGVYKGRTRTLTPDKAHQLRARAAAGEPKTALAKEFGISRETVYTYLRAQA